MTDLTPELLAELRQLAEIPDYDALSSMMRCDRGPAVVLSLISAAEELGHLQDLVTDWQDRAVAAEAKCDLLSASLKKAEADIESQQANAGRNYQRQFERAEKAESLVRAHEAWGGQAALAATQPLQERVAELEAALRNVANACGFPAHPAEIVSVVREMALKAAATPSQKEAAGKCLPAPVERTCQNCFYMNSCSPFKARTDNRCSDWKDEDGTGRAQAEEMKP